MGSVSTGHFIVLIYAAFWVALVVLVYKCITRFFQLCRDVAGIKTLLQSRERKEPEGAAESHP
jgi:hypothetical protein